MPDQIQLVVKSLKDFKNNLIVLVPILLSIGLGLLFVIFIGLQAALGSQILKDLYIFEVGFSASSIAYIAVFGLIDIAVLFLISSYVAAAQYGVVADVVLQGKSSFKRLLQHGKTFFKPVYTLMIAEFIILAAPFALFFIIAVIAELTSSVMSSGEAGSRIFAVFFGLVYLLFLILFYAITLFKAPILVSRRLGGFKVIMESFRYGKSHFEHVITTLAVVVVLWIITSVIETIVYIPSFAASIASELTPGAGTALSLSLTSILFSVLSSIVSAIGGIIILLYIFNSYFSRNSLKNWK